jgi:hypothetical protein
MADNQLGDLVRVLSESRILSLDASTRDVYSQAAIGLIAEDGSQMSEQSMIAQMKTRLEMLKNEMQLGRNELISIESRRTYLNETILRISGAIQLLEELLREEAG